MEPSDFASPEVRELRRQVALACRILYQLDLIDYLGHPSARIGDSQYVVIKPGKSERVKGGSTMTTDKMIIVDLDGRQYAGDNPPPSEVSLHLEIYRARPDVGAVVHTHQTMSTVFGTVGRPIQPIFHLQAAWVPEDIAVYPHAHLIINPERGREMAQALGQHRMMHLQGHGIITTAPTIQEATIGAVLLEDLAKVNYYAQALGTPRVIPPDEIASLKAELAPPSVRWAYYTSLVDEPE